MFSRYIKGLLEELLQDFRILYLTGPRQSGKTTLARQIAKKTGMKYVSLDDQTVFASAKNDPQGFVESLSSNGPVVLDEFQYLPELVGAIKLVSDRLGPKEKGRFFLTGSADIFKSAKVKEALPGHMARAELLPLSATETSDGKFNLIDYLVSGQYKPIKKMPKLSREDIASAVLKGGYPEPQEFSKRSRASWFKSYLEGRLFKDFENVYAAKGEYHTKLKALLPYLAGLSGNLLKYASVANDLSQNDKVVKSYIEALEWMFIFRRLHPYVKNRAKRESIGMPKIHMIDTGLACHLLGLVEVEQLLASNHYGGLLENFVLMEGFKHLAWSKNFGRFYHFRDRQKKEVDIVLETDNGSLVAIEVKASSTVTPRDFVGIEKFRAHVGDAMISGVVFYSGREIQRFKFSDHYGYALPIALLWS